MLDWLFRRDKELLPEEYATIIGYYDRTHRGFVEVDSEAMTAVKMMFLTDKPGKYTGTGDKIIEL